VVEEADKVVRLIVDFYPKPNKTFSELRAMMNDNSLDLLRDFSESCREELQELARSSATRAGPGKSP
jgi:hypothetical protein